MEPPNGFDEKEAFDQLGVDPKTFNEKMMKDPLFLAIAMFTAQESSPEFSTKKILRMLTNILKTTPNVRKRINEPAWVTKDGMSGLCPLHRLCSYSMNPGVPPAVKLLIEKYGANYEKKYFSAAFQKAQKSKNFRIPKYMRPYLGSTPLLFACKSQYSIQNENERKTIKYLLGTARANPNSFSQEGFSVLGCQIMNCDLELIELSLKMGANPNGFEYLSNKVGFKKYLSFLYKIRELALHWPNIVRPGRNRRESYEIVQFVQTPLFRLIAFSKSEEKTLKVLKLMKKYGLDVNFPQNKLSGISGGEDDGAVNLQLHMWNSLFYAIEKKYVNVVRWLVEEGKINLSYENYKIEKTALTESIRFGGFEYLCILKKNGYKVLGVDRLFFSKNGISHKAMDYYFSDDLSIEEFKKRKFEILESVKSKPTQVRKSQKREKPKDPEEEAFERKIKEDTERFAREMNSNEELRRGYEKGMRWLYDRKKNRAEAAAKEMKKKCYMCGKEAKKFCSRCRKVYYCSRKCQVGDWKMHKQYCSTLASTSWIERQIIDQ